mgnify:CR=1 FL=1
MPWLNVEEKQSLREVAAKQGVFPSEVWEHPRNKKFADASTDGYDVFLPSGAWIYIPDDEERIVSQQVREERRRKKKPPRPPRAKTRSNLTNVFKRPRSDADAEDRAKYILTAARPAFKAVHKDHTGLMAKIKGGGRYHRVDYTKRSTLQKAALKAPGTAATGAGIVITIVGLATAATPAGWIMIPIGLSALAVTKGLEAFFRHQDYKKRKVYYQKEMYCTAEGKAKGKEDYDQEKSKARDKWYRKAIVKLTPKKLETYVRVKDDIWQRKEFWREQLMRDANHCIRPAVVHLRKARVILAEHLGGFFKAVDPNVEDRYGIIDLKSAGNQKKEPAPTSEKTVTKPTEEEIEEMEEGRLDRPIDFDSYRELARCDEYIKHAKPAMRYLHELDKFRNYLLPSLNMCVFCLDEFESMSREWKTRQELVEDAINRFQKKNDHGKCGRFKRVKDVLTPGKLKSFLKSITHFKSECYDQSKRPDIYLYQGQPGQSAGSGKKSGGEQSSGQSGSPRPKTLEVVKLKEMQSEYAVALQEAIKYDQLRVAGVQHPGTTPPGNQRAERFLADVAKVYDQPGYLDQLSHRIKNYDMSTTKFEKFSCFAEHGFSVTTKALAGGIIPSVYKFGTKAAGVATNKVVKFSLSATEKIGKAVADKASKAIDNKQARDSGSADDYYTFADGSNPYIMESDVLKTIKNEMSLDTPIKRIIAMEYKIYEDEYEEIKGELDEKLDKGEIDEDAYQQGMAELNHVFYGVKKERVKRQKQRSGKSAKKAAIGVERTFKQLDYHYKKARSYVKLFSEIDDMAEKRKELKIRLRSCNQCYRYAYLLYDFHHELEKMERYLMASISVVAQLSEEAVTYGEYVPAIWQVLDGATGGWIREDSNHEHCLDRISTFKKGKYCYGPNTKVGAAPGAVRKGL